MFLKNKYTKYYYSIINKSKKRKLKIKFIERHHIIPKCIGGSDNKNNITILTTREHFLVHLLLTKIQTNIYNKNKIDYAFWCMCNGFTSKNQKRNYILSSRQYENIKNKISKIRSDNWKDPEKNPNKSKWMLGKGNPMYGVHRYGKDNPFYNKKHNKHSKKIQSYKISKWYSENDNPTKNTIWINNGNINRRITVTNNIPEGFVRGIIRRKK